MPEPLRFANIAIKELGAMDSELYAWFPAFLPDASVKFVL